MEQGIDHGATALAKVHAKKAKPTTEPATAAKEPAALAAAEVNGNASDATQPRGARESPAAGDGPDDGRGAARYLRQRVFRQEPPPPGLRQPAQGSAHHCEGGGR